MVFRNMMSQFLKVVMNLGQRKSHFLLTMLVFEVNDVDFLD